MPRKRIFELDDQPDLSLDDLFPLDRALGLGLFKTYKTELRNIRDAIIAGESDSLLLETGDNLLLEHGGFVLLESESSPLPGSYIEPILTVPSNQVLDGLNYYRITGGTSFTVALSAALFNAAVPFSMTIKNVSGSVITITRTGSDKFFSLTGLINSFDLSNGESIRLVSAAATTWDII